MDLEKYKRTVLNSATTAGEAFRNNSNIIMEASWDRDVQAKTCYIYDYKHDSEPFKNVGLDPANDEKKTAVQAKFIVYQYDDANKDQVESHLQFMPSHECELDYFNYYEETYQMEYPIGLYVDIPDQKGVYHKWLICDRTIEQQFIKYSILPCNYLFHWVYENKFYDMWGVSRSRSSYSSGISTASVMTTVNNQDSMWMPMNDVTINLYYDQRFIIGTSAMKRPPAWKVIDIGNTHPFGVQKLGLIQDKFDPSTDEKIGNYWYAGYGASAITPSDGGQEEQPVENTNYSVLSTKANNIKVGSARSITAKFYNALGEVITASPIWFYSIEGYDEIPPEDVTLEGTETGCKITINNDEYLDTVLTVSVSDSDGTAASSIELEIISL